MVDVLALENPRLPETVAVTAMDTNTNDSNLCCFQLYP